MTLVFVVGISVGLADRPKDRVSTRGVKEIVGSSLRFGQELVEVSRVNRLKGNPIDLPNSVQVAPSPTGSPG